MPPTIPDFGAVLGPVIAPLPETVRVGFLARLERVAAERYRAWAEAWPEERDGLLACAGREEEIARRAEALAPVPPEHEDALGPALGEARRLYAAAFEEHDLRTQLTLQAHAERQGALAWRAHAAAADDDETRRALLALAALECASADFLDGCLGIASDDAAVSAGAGRPAAG